MKKILVLILVASMASVVVNAEPTKYKIEVKTLPSFKIFKTNYGTPDPARDNLPIVEYDGVTGYTIYKTERYIVDKPDEYRLVLDKSGKPVKASPTDKDFYETLFKAFQSMPKPYFVGDANTESISIVVTYPPSKNLSAKAYVSKYCKKDVYNSYGNPLYMANPFPPKNGAICYMDSNFHIEWRELQNGKLVVTRREAINPDMVKWDTMPGLESHLIMAYRSYENRCKGYIQCANKSKNYICNGNTYDHEGFITIKNSTSFVDFFMLQSMLSCEYKVEKSGGGAGITNRYTSYRLYKERNSNSVDTIALSVRAGSTDYLLNDTTGKFTVAPYWKSDTMMVPLKEVCDALKAKVIYRPLDGTILIARFFEN